MESTPEMEAGKRNSWMTHLNKFRRANKGMSLSKAMKMAKKTYKKTRKGGALSPMPLTGGGGVISPASVGGRRRGSRKTKRSGRKY